MDKNIVRHGFILILLALISGLFVTQMVIPRLGVSAHTIGVLSGVLLIAVGVIGPSLALSVRQRRVMSLSWLYSSYVNWAACLLGAVLGAGETTPVAAAGVTGSALGEGIVALLLVSVAMASFIAVGLSLYGLRTGPEAAEQ